jgi:hypothetical protein
MTDSFVENPIHLRRTFRVFSEGNRQVLSQAATAHTPTFFYAILHLLYVYVEPVIFETCGYQLPGGRIT